MSALGKKLPSSEELIEQAGLRQEIYRVQAAAFLDSPDAELLDFLVENYPFLFPRERQERTASFEKALRVDFTNLFLISTPPYEAALVDESGHLNSGATDRVTDFYRSCGFNPGRGGGVSRNIGLVAMDHISVELEFLAHLAGREENAWRGEDRPLAAESLSGAARFMDAHLLRWMPLLMASTEEDADTDFYRALSKWTREFAFEDRKHIEKILRST